MNLRLLILKAATIVSLVMTATNAAADLCRDVLSVRGDNQIFASALAVSSNRRLSDYDLDLLDGLIRSAQGLQEYDLFDPALARAISAYSRQMEGLRDAKYRNNDRAIVRLATAPAYRNALENLSGAGRTYCMNITASGGSQSQERNATAGPLSSMSWQTVIPTTVGLAFLIAGAIYWGMRLATMKKKRQQRYDCNVAVTIASTAGTFETRMIDISAMGAKIALPDNAELSTAATLIVDGLPFACRKSWDNAHYAGIIFNKPMRGRQVRAWAGARQTQKVAKTVALSKQSTV